MYKAYDHDRCDRRRLKEGCDRKAGNYAFQFTGCENRQDASQPHSRNLLQALAHEFHPEQQKAYATQKG